MHIEQIVIEFVSIEDRLLMTVHVDGPSIRVWLTRRYVRLLRSALNDILGHQVIASRPLAVGSNTLLAELMHEQAIANVDLSTPPISRHHSASAQADSDTELDSSHTVASGSTSGSSGTNGVEDAWLAVQLQTMWDEQDQPQRRATAISFLPKAGTGITFNLDDKLPHAFAEMLARSCESAQWDLDFAPLGTNAKSSQVLHSSTRLH
ncbi:MAG: hypothetical protein NWS83_10300 [Burkholderiaceae bacterium]|nr:hypothetical protein [Burkholderiaceae bacterium]